MNKHFLKTIRDDMPEPLKLLTAPVFRNKLIKNEEFRNYYSLLVARESLGPGEKKEYQFLQLKDILTHSYRNVPYYHDLFDKVSFDPLKFSDFDQVKKIPFLTRELVTANFDRLISREEAKNGYYSASTGGSSGLKLNFLLDYDSIYKENAFIYYFRRRLGYDFKDRMVTFRQVGLGEKSWKFNPMHNEMIFTPTKLSKHSIIDFVKRINKFKPDYLNGYLSAIWYFAKLLEEYDISIDFNLKGIFLISEIPDKLQRKFVEEFFKTRSMTFYGHSERCVIAEEVVRDGYKFDPYYGFTEKIHVEDNKYEIIGTGFLNRTMPFIRYKTDDLCFSGDEYCSIEGKRSSTSGLYGINNRFLPHTSLLLRDPVYRNITTYQYVQKEMGRADLLIIVNKDHKPEDIVPIKKELDNQMEGAIDLQIKIVENLILSPRGKYQMFISNVARG
jgi:phenylacetate-coenzyme A ligase PaaK-like adenylate-forming protein